MSQRSQKTSIPTSPQARVALSALNSEIRRQLSAGDDPDLMSLDHPLVVDALAESHRSGRTVGAKQHWLTLRVREVRHWMVEHPAPVKQAGPGLIFAQRARRTMATMPKGTPGFIRSQLVLGYLADTAERDDLGEPRFSTRTAASDLNVGPTTVRRALDDLEAFGLQHRNSRDGSRAWFSDVFMQVSSGGAPASHPRDALPDRPWCATRDRAAIYERAGLGPRGRWSMPLLRAGGATRAQFRKVVPGTPATVDKHLARMEELGLGRWVGERFVPVPCLEQALRTAEVESGASEQASKREARYALERAWWRQREVLIQEAIERHGLSVVTKPDGGLVFIVMEADPDLNVERAKFMAAA